MLPGNLIPLQKRWTLFLFTGGRKDYIFSPPFCLISKVLQKIETDKANAIVIVPFWTTQPWWGKLIRLLTDCPLSFHRNRSTLHHPHRQPEELPRMTLLACNLSGISSLQIRSLLRHKPSLCRHGESLPLDNIRHTSRGGKSLLLGSQSIHIHPL